MFALFVMLRSLSGRKVRADITKCSFRQNGLKGIREKRMFEAVLLVKELFALEDNFEACIILLSNFPYS